MTRAEAERILKSRFGIEHFYDEQWMAISSLLRGERVLLIERTGFGKSLCYQFPAVVLDGLTVVFSPLIALMRDQVASLKARGIPSGFLNCEQTEEERASVLEQARAGMLKILYIAPERQESSVWEEAVRHIRLSMVVVDEAHTISTWGHDFRPAFRRIVNLVNLLPAGMPVLATTATATANVQRDVEAQLGMALHSIRGSLVRPNFRLFVLKTEGEDGKYVWLRRNIPLLEGSGLVYCGTRAEVDKYAEWLRRCGISVAAYHAGLDAETRKRIEEGLKNNEWKCIVSTNALGMGNDKNDIRFIVHTQMPASPVHYYQEIGRAGRDGLPTTVVLLFNSALDSKGEVVDLCLPKAFIEGARPSVEKCQMVVEAVKSEPLRESDIVRHTNMKTTQVRVIKADLIDQRIIREVKYGKEKRYEYVPGATSEDFSGFERLRLAKLDDLEKMVGYIDSREPRMKYLCDFLGENESVLAAKTWAGTCDNSGLEPLSVVMDEESVRELQEFRDNYFPALEVEVKSSNLRNGVAASYYGDTEVGAAVHRSKYGDGGDFSDFLVSRTLRAIRKTFHGIKFDIVAWVPPTKSGKLVENFAKRIASAIGSPAVPCVVKVKETVEQKYNKNSYSKHENVRGAYGVSFASVVEGRNYYGARYYDARLAMWYGVDALAEKYPNMGGNAYCAGNPVV